MLSKMNALAAVNEQPKTDTEWKSHEKVQMLIKLKSNPDKYRGVAIGLGATSAVAISTLTPLVPLMIMQCGFDITKLNKTVKSLAQSIYNYMTKDKIDIGNIKQESCEEFDLIYNRVQSINTKWPWKSDVEYLDKLDVKYKLNLRKKIDIEQKLFNIMKVVFGLSIDNPKKHDSELQVQFITKFKEIFSLLNANKSNVHKIIDNVLIHETSLWDRFGLPRFVTKSTISVDSQDLLLMNFKRVKSVKVDSPIILSELLTHLHENNITNVDLTSYTIIPNADPIIVSFDELSHMINSRLGHELGFLTFQMNSYPTSDDYLYLCTIRQNRFIVRRIHRSDKLLSFYEEIYETKCITFNLMLGLICFCSSIFTMKIGTSLMGMFIEQLMNKKGVTMEVLIDQYMDDKLTYDESFDLTCPITKQIMRNPVKCSDNRTYERSAIEEWLTQSHNTKRTSPMDPSHYPLKILEDDIQMKTKIDRIRKAASKEAEEIYREKLKDIIGTKASMIISRFATIKILHVP